MGEENCPESQSSHGRVVVASLVVAVGGLAEVLAEVDSQVRIVGQSVRVAVLEAVDICLMNRKWAAVGEAGSRRYLSGGGLVEIREAAGIRPPF